MIDGIAVQRNHIDLVKLTAGGVLIAAFFGLDKTSNTIQIQFVPMWDRSNAGELYFWLGAIMFLLPGSALVGASFARLTAPLFERLRARLDAGDRREQFAMLVAFAVLATSLAWLGNQLVLLGQPFTDDEDAARFGGQILASGALQAPLPPLRFAFPDLFLFQREGSWTSFDFLGALLPWVAAELTHTDTFVFSLFAGLTPACVAWATMRREGATMGLVAGGLFLCSPMALTLSLTSHAHVVSRGWLALGLALLLFLETPSLRRCSAAGAVFGLSFATRPPEITMLLLPLVVSWLYAARGDATARRRVLGLALGALPVIVLVFAYNYALGGSFGFLRSAPNEISVPYGEMFRPPFALSRLWPRFGNNLSYNAITLSIWFWGPIGLFLAWLGTAVSRVHALLGLGVLLDLGLSLLHDDRGLHMVGPIHLSETAVPLALLAASGIPRLFTGLAKLGIARSHAAATLLGYAALGLGTFSFWHSRALHVQALARVTLTALVEDVAQRPAVVLAPPYDTLWQLDRTFARVGGFAFEWRRARPDLAEPVLILRDSERARFEVRQAFPDRTAYVFVPQKYGPVPVPLAELPEAHSAAP